MKYIKNNWKFLLFVLITGSIGCYFATIYTMNLLPEETLEEAIKQVSSKDIVIAISAVQAVIYTMIFAFLGVILSNKIGLWKKLNFEKKKIFTTLIIALIGGIVLILGDLLIFGRFNDIILHSFDLKPTYDYLVMAFFYGGVVEEVMLRLFFMSLISFIIYKMFYRKEKTIPVRVFIIANIISAILFALGHIPTTINTFGGLTTLLFIRCMLMNGIFGLAFGLLYRKYGIQYSMLAHFGCHLISKLIWIIFI